MRRRRRASPTVAYDVAWTETLIELFRLAPADASKPRQVRVRRTTQGLTVVGVFERSNAPTSTITVRLRLRADGEATVLSESLKVSLRLQVGAP